MECMGCYDGQKIWKEVIAVLDMSIDLERGVYISMISCRMVNHIGSTLWGSRQTIPTSLELPHGGVVILC